MAARPWGGRAEMRLPWKPISLAQTGCTVNKPDLRRRPAGSRDSNSPRRLRRPLQDCGAPQCAAATLSRPRPRPRARSPVMQQPETTHARTGRHVGPSQLNPGMLTPASPNLTIGLRDLSSNPGLGLTSSPPFLLVPFILSSPVCSSLQTDSGSKLPARLKIEDLILDYFHWLFQTGVPAFPIPAPANGGARVARPPPPPPPRAYSAQRADASSEPKKPPCIPVAASQKEHFS